MEHDKQEFRVLSSGVLSRFNQLNLADLVNLPKHRPVAADSTTGF